MKKIFYIAIIGIISLTHNNNHTSNEWEENIQDEWRECDETDLEQPLENMEQSLGDINAILESIKFLFDNKE